MKITYVGLDVHKRTIAIACADDGRDGEVRFWGVIENAPHALKKVVRTFADGNRRVDFCYEAGCCGYGIYRQLTAAGVPCSVVAPSRIPKAPGDRIKTDRRDAQRLAILHRAGELTPVWVPDRSHEAMRDLVRARLDAAIHQARTRQQLLAFLLRHGRTFEAGRKHWTHRHKLWLGTQTFDEPAQNDVFQDYVEAVWSASDRHEALKKRISEHLPEWSLSALVEAMRCLRGLELVSAATIVAGVGDTNRFETPRQLMSYLGLTPSEHSSGSTTRRGGITKAGNGEVRRMLIEAAWSYRYPARLSQEKARLLERQPAAIRNIAWEAQRRLCKRYRQLTQRGKKSTIVVPAIARELCGFVWALGRETDVA